MDLGAVFPTREIGTDPERIRAFARRAEAAGFDHLLTANRDLGKNLDRPDRNDRYGVGDPFHEPLVLFGHLAAVTDHLEFVTGVLVLPQRQTALVAKQAAAVDVLSGGRLRLGIGVGSDPVSYTALDQGFETRGRRVEEQVTLLRALWTEAVVTFDGDFHTLEDVGINPRPVQQPIPIWMGGGKTEAVLRRIARLADGWIPSGSWSSDELRSRLEFVRSVMADHGRPSEALGVQGRLVLDRDDPDAWLDGVSEWQSLGATHLAVTTMGAGREPADHAAAIEQFMTAVDDAGVLD